MTQPERYPIEQKVKWATAGAYIASSAALAILNAVGDTNLISGLPPVLEIFLAPLIPTLVTFLAGYRARHTPRAR